MTYRWAWGAVIAIAACASLARASEPMAVDLALVLAVDVSMSVDQSEAVTQRAGYIHALRDKRVVAAIKGGPIGRIAITFVEWSSPYHQVTILPWRVVSDEASAKKMADDLESTPYVPGTTTSISGGLDYSVKLFRNMDYEPSRKVIDISGDGYSDFGRPVSDARDDAVKAGITVNGLAVIVKSANSFRQAAPADLDSYYRDNVIGGPGSFYLAVYKLEDFSRSVLQKLVLEISGLQPEANAVTGVN
jgi:hypothetical protein